jgi:hypothetical protein
MKLMKRALMSLRSQRIAAWCGPVFVVLFGLGFLLAHFVPPPSPSLSAPEIAREYGENRLGVKTGVMLAMTGAGFYLPFTAVVAMQLRRIEGPYSPWAYTQLASGAALVTLFIIPFMGMQTAVYRDDRTDDEVVRAFSDFGWMAFAGTIPPPTVQLLTVAAVVLSNRSAREIFPRWVGYLNLFVAATFLPAAVLVFFHDGPLAWNGVFTWWLPAATYFGWIVVMLPMLLKAIKSQEQELSAAAPVSDPALRS